MPGSAKSTLAQLLAPNVGDNPHDGLHKANFAADDYHTDRDGNYNFDRKSLGKAHLWCRESVERAMKREVERIAVANTFTTKGEIQHYIDLCNDNDYTPCLIQTRNEFGSIHGVPQATLDEMRARFHDLVVKKREDGQFVLTEFKNPVVWGANIN